MVSPGPPGDPVVQVSPPFGNVRDDFQHPVDPDSAGNTLAAGFVLEEIQEIFGHIHHAGSVVHDHHAARTDHGAGFGKGVEIHRQIEQAYRQTSARRAAGLYRLDRFSVVGPATDVER